MTATTLANVIQVVATLIALVGVAVSFVYSKRGQQLQREQAQQAAEQAAESNRAAQAAAQRSAAASALTIDDLQRIAVALEDIAVSGSRSTGYETRAPRPTVAWTLVPTGSETFRLTNVGSATAHDVWVGGAASLDGPHDIVPGRSVAAGVSLTFRAAILPTTTDATITVTWASTGGATDRHSWRYPLLAPPA
ncbi:MAG: hypothetical protein JWP75_2059 [Frondihabitans sp.]|nr:hypothetical protein [Frondihabitans sp.]